jgi:hypothetical protein
MKISFGSKLQLQPGSLVEATWEIAIGSLSGGIRACHLLVIWCYVNLVRPAARLAGVHLPEGKREKMPGGTIQVVAVGFGRTGTVRCFSCGSLDECSSPP